MTKRQRLTDKAVEKALPPGNGRIALYDDLVDGLALRITSNGAKSWNLIYRLDGRMVRETLGRYPAVTLADARDRAKDKLILVSKGQDPRREKARQRAARATAEAQTFRKIAELYRDDVLATKRSGTEQWAAIERDLIPLWGDLPIADITRGMVLDRLQKLAKPAAPGQPRRVHARNRRAAIIRQIFNFAMDEVGIVDRNPAARIKMLEEGSRDRVLTDSEIVEIWSAAGKLPQPWPALIRLLILTGQRRSEIAGLEWSEVDETDKLLLIPAARMKSGKMHEIPLPPAAWELLSEPPTYTPARAHVFATPHRKEGAVNSFSQIKSDLDRLILEARQESDPDAVPMAGWRLHDLRRTFRSGLAALRIPAEIAERVISHLPGGVQAVYDRFAYRDEKRAAIAAWCNHVAALIEPAPSNVTPIEKARGKRTKG